MGGDLRLLARGRPAGRSAAGPAASRSWPGSSSPDARRRGTSTRKLRSRSRPRPPRDARPARARLGGGVRRDDGDDPDRAPGRHRRDPRRARDARRRVRGRPRAPRSSATTTADAWKFFLAGLLAPGLSQILFTRSIEEAGASRTSVTVGAAPLFALAIAFTLLGEPVQAGARRRRGRDRRRRHPARRRARPSRPPAGARPPLRARRRRPLRRPRQHRARAAHRGQPRDGRRGGAARRHPRRRSFRRGACRRGASCGASRRRACCSASPISACSRRTSAAASRSSRRSSRPSRSGASALAALVFGRSEGVGRRVIFGAAAIVAGGVLIGLSRHPVDDLI